MVLVFHVIKFGSSLKQNFVFCLFNDADNISDRKMIKEQWIVIRLIRGINEAIFCTYWEKPR